MQEVLSCVLVLCKNVRGSLKRLLRFFISRRQ